MAPSPDDEQDRRGHERRIDALEKQYLAVAVAVNDVKTQQAHHSEIMALSFTGVDARFTTSSRENGLIIEKLDGLRELVNDTFGDAERSPVGRALAKDIVALGKDNAKTEMAMNELKEEAAELRGALKFVRYSIGVLAGGLVAAGVALVRLMITGKALP